MRILRKTYLVGQDIQTFEFFYDNDDETESDLLDRVKDTIPSGAIEFTGTPPDLSFFYEYSVTDGVIDRQIKTAPVESFKKIVLAKLKEDWQEKKEKIALSIDGKTIELDNDDVTELTALLSIGGDNTLSFVAVDGVLIEINITKAENLLKLFNSERTTLRNTYNDERIKLIGADTYQALHDTIESFGEGHVLYKEYL